MLYGVLDYDLTPDTTISAGVSQQRQSGNSWLLGLPTWNDFTLLDIDRGRALNTDWSYADRRITDVFASVEHRFGADWALKFSASRQKFDSDTLRINPTGPIDRATGGFADIFSRYETGNHSKAVDLNLQGGFGMWGRQHKLLVGADWRESNAHQNMYALSEVYPPGSIGLGNFDQLNGSRPDVLFPWFTFPAYGATQRASTPACSLRPATGCMSSSVAAMAITNTTRSTTTMTARPGRCCPRPRTASRIPAS